MYNLNSLLIISLRAIFYCNPKSEHGIFSNFHLPQGLKGILSFIDRQTQSEVANRRQQIRSITSMKEN